MIDLNRAEWKAQTIKDASAVILDVRTLEEVEEGIIPNAIHIDIYKGQGFIDEVAQLDKSKNYYVYCRSGGRSAQACTLMDDLGFKQTFNLLEGYSQWDGETEQLL